MKLSPNTVISACSLLATSAVLATSAYLFAQAHPPGTPGHEKSGKTKLLEAGAEMFQREGPVSSIHQHVCGFHFVAGDPKRQVRAHHYCAHPNEEFLQCVIYDSPGKDARLIGIEYIVSERIFKTLPADEKVLWHSHKYEVLSGQLIAPGVPDVAEKEVMKKLVSTYGKTWHTWQTDRGDKLPLGLPKLMMGFTADGQGNLEMLLLRDRDLGTNTTEKRGQRADLSGGDIAEGADAWQQGRVFQIPDDLLKDLSSK